MYMTASRDKEFAAKLLDALAADAGLPGLLRILMQALASPVLLADPAGRILCLQAPGREVPWPEGLVPPEIVREGSRCPPGKTASGVAPARAGEGIRYKVTPVGREAEFGYLAVLSQGYEDPAREAWLTQTATACAVVMRSREARQRAQQAAQEELVEDLLSHRFQNLAELACRHPLAWDLDRPQAALVIEADRAGSGTVPETVNRQLGHLVRERVPGADYVVAPRGEQWVVLMAFPSMLSPAAFKEQVQDWVGELRRRAYPYLEGRPFAAGAGRLYPGAGDIYLSFQEAKTALEIGRFGRSAGGVTFFEDLGVLRVLHRLGMPRLREFAREVLGPLEAYDWEHGTDLLFTLRTYFQCQMDMAATSVRLGVHGNTLRYRLKKAEEVLAVDIGKIEVQANLYLALTLVAGA